jgi:hypothetical protein
LGAAPQKQFDYALRRGSRWQIFGLFFPWYDRQDPRIFFCPSDTSQFHQFDSMSNPWKTATGAFPATIRSGYGARLKDHLGNDVAWLPGDIFPLPVPRLSKLKNRALFGDLVSQPDRVLARHKKGINMLYANGGAHWIDISKFQSILMSIPPQPAAFAPAYNPQMDQMFEIFDKD